MKSAKERLSEIKEKLEKYHLDKLQAQSQSQTCNSINPGFKPVVGNIIKTTEKTDDTVSEKSDIILLETEDKIVVTNRAQLLREAVAIANSWKKKHPHVSKSSSSRSCSHVLEILREELKHKNDHYKEEDISRYDFDEYIFADSLVPCHSFVHYLGSEFSCRSRRGMLFEDTERF